MSENSSSAPRSWVTVKTFMLNGAPISKPVITTRLAKHNLGKTPFKTLPQLKLEVRSWVTVRTFTHQKTLTFFIRLFEMKIEKVSFKILIAILPSHIEIEFYS